jgi:hypothetical protein
VKRFKVRNNEQASRPTKVSRTTLGNWWHSCLCGALLTMPVISLKLSEKLDTQLTEQAQRRRLSKSELVRRALTTFLQTS